MTRSAERPPPHRSPQPVFGNARKSRLRVTCSFTRGAPQRKHTTARRPSTTDFATSRIPEATDTCHAPCFEPHESQTRTPIFSSGTDVRRLPPRLEQQAAARRARSSTYFRVTPETSRSPPHAKSTHTSSASAHHALRTKHRAPATQHQAPAQSPTRHCASTFLPCWSMLPSSFV